MNMNSMVIIGRVTADPEIKKLEDGKEVTNMTVAVQRPYKNENGVYDTDFVDCTLWNALASNVCEYCHKGDLVGVKGRIQTNVYETESGEKKKITQLIADKVTFLASKHKDESLDKDNSDDMEM